MMLFQKHKITIVAAVLFLTLGIMLTNMSDRREYDSLDNTVSSIYNDRLIPAGILFDINTILYNKKSLTRNHPGENFSNSRSASIGDLISQYEKTYLTSEEKLHWTAFRSSLTGFDGSIESFQQTPSEMNRVAVDTRFAEIESHLQQLIAIQKREGKKLQTQSLRIIDNTRLNAWLESALLFIICIVLLRWGGINEKLAGLSKDRAVLN